jgi:hypothetical protein
MRLAAAVPLALVALVACKGRPADLKIDVLLEMQNGKCVVRFAKPRLKDAKVAIGYTGHAVIWEVKRNGCGEKTRNKEGAKALGLKFLKRRGAAEAPKWFDTCQWINVVPSRFQTPPAFRCDVPSTKDQPWEGTDEIQFYEYEIDGNSVEPADPGLGIKRNG